MLGDSSKYNITTLTYNHTAYSMYIYICVYHSWNMLELYQYLSPRRPIILYVLLSFTINRCGKTPYNYSYGGL